MRRVFCAAMAAFAVANSFADAQYSCTYNGASLADIPLTNPPLEIDQVVPTDPTLDGTRYWQISLCTQTPYSGCSKPAGYVMEINGNLDGCDAGFVNALSDSWTSNYGGANALFGAQYQNPNDRIANVTLLCDPSATTLQPVGIANAHPSQGGAVWVFDIVLKSNAVCGGPLPPPPPPPPPSSPPPLPPPTFWTSAAPFTAPPPAASYNCSFAGGTITDEVSQLSILVSPGSTYPSQYYNWSFSFCKLSNDAICSWPNSYIRMETGWPTCFAAFNFPLNTEWGFDYGGANAWFGAHVGTPNSIGGIANVTILCDPAASTLTAVGPVVINAAPGGDVNFYNIRLASSSVCRGTLPPAPTPPPPPQGAITIEAYPALYCGGRGVTSYITPGCVANGPSGSVFSVCTSDDGSTLQQFYFRNSTTCAGAPALTETTAVNQCVNSEILEGRSTQLLSCTAS